MATNSDQTRQPEPIDRRRLFLSVGLSLLFFILSLFLPAGTWTWTKGLAVLLRDGCGFGPGHARTCDGSTPMSSLAGSIATRHRDAGICCWVLIDASCRP